MKLNLGSGLDYKPGFINLDSDKNLKADIYHNINKFPWPFPDNTFSEIHCFHILEHVDNLIETMQEIKRISKKGAIIKIKVPLFPSIHSVSDPTHKRYFTYITFNYFTDKSFYNIPRFNIKTRKIKFSWSNKTKWLDKLINLAPVFYSRFLSSILPSNELYIELLNS